MNISNQVYVHNQTSNIFTFCITFYLIFLYYIFPIIIFPLIIYFIITIKNVIFETLDKNSDNFINIIHQKLFNNNTFFLQFILISFGKMLIIVKMENLTKPIA